MYHWNAEGSAYEGWNVIVSAPDVDKARTIAFDAFNAEHDEQAPFHLDFDPQKVVEGDGAIIILTESHRPSQVRSKTNAEVSDDPIVKYAHKGGPLPRVGVIRDSFWAGYKGGLNRLHAGVPSSVQRRAYQAGMARAKAEPGIKIT